MASLSRRVYAPMMRSSAWCVVHLQLLLLLGVTKQRTRCNALREIWDVDFFHSKILANSTIAVIDRSIRSVALILHQRTFARARRQSLERQKSGQCRVWGSTGGLNDAATSYSKALNWEVFSCVHTSRCITGDYWRWLVPEKGH